MKKKRGNGFLLEKKRCRLLIRGRKKPQLLRWEETTGVYRWVPRCMLARAAAHGCSAAAVLACRLWRIRAGRCYAREHDCVGRVLALSRAATRALAVFSPCSQHAQAHPHRLCSPTPAALPCLRSTSPPCPTCSRPRSASQRALVG